MDLCELIGDSNTEVQPISAINQDGRVIQFRQCEELPNEAGSRMWTTFEDIMADLEFTGSVQELLESEHLQKLEF